MPLSRNPPLHDTLGPASPYGLCGTDSWALQLLRRVRHRFFIKFAAISAFNWIFFLAYFHLLRHPAGPVTEMPLTALDDWIPFSPAALAAYVSLWVYTGVPAGLMTSLRQLIIYGLWIGLMCGAGLALFYVFPTAVPAPDLPVDVALHPGFALLQGVDSAGNAFPSLHVATALFSAVWIERILGHLGTPAWLRALNWLWLCLIVYSTLAIKQHVVLDVLAGMALAALFAWPSMRWFMHTAPRDVQPTR